MTELIAKFLHDEHYITMAYLNSKNMRKNKANVKGRIKVSYKGYYLYTDVAIDDSLPDDVIGVNQWLCEWMVPKEGDIMVVDKAEDSHFEKYLEKVKAGIELSDEDMEDMIQCFCLNNFVPQHLFDFLYAINDRDLSLREISLFADYFTENSSYITFDKPTFGFHSLGGIPGNKITPIVVSIVASAGVTIPKLSTHAITSACGTVDSVELYCNVVIKSKEIKDICLKTGGIFACVNSLYLETYNLDKFFMTAESFIGINPRSIMLASIMAEEKSSGVTNLLIDIPVWQDAKIKNEEMAREYENQFVTIGKQIGINVKCITTDASQPIGFSIGPALEAIEVLRILEGKDKSSSAIDKACLCAGTILEMAGKKDGKKLAKKLLSSGRALEKFRGIVAAQGGSKDVSSEDFTLGKYHIDVISESRGKVNAINNKVLTAVAKVAGAPSDKKAGLILKKKIGDTVKVGETIATIYSEDGTRLILALKEFLEHRPYTVS